ncbi:hypothetical protein [Aquipseudomonas alcaligenes]|uniref:hypothetical protein n=1 Tax=Aquipseudomonas alcaligenes TaxID=43263 RepID=UPI001F17ACFD|nr:hypothetical protein [Pseudomonas alcaligenes]
MKKALPLAMFFLTSQAMAFSPAEISGTWECMIPGRTYTDIYTADGKYESHQGDGSDYAGTYSLEGDFLYKSYVNTNYQSGNLSSGYTVAKLTSNQLVLQSDGKLISCSK